MSDDPIFICHMPSEAFAAAATGINRWPDSPPAKLFWHNDGGVGKVSALDFRGIIPFGLRKIEGACGIRFEYTPNIKTANIVLRQARHGEGGMGQPGNVLADCELVPPGLRSNSDFQATNRYDGFEDWSSATDLVGGRVPMMNVVAHEVAHGVGLGHAPAGSNDLQAPSIQRGVTEFGTWAKREFVRRYGESASAPQPGAPPAAGDVWETKYQNGLLIVKRNGVLQRLSPSPFGG